MTASPWLAGPFCGRTSCSLQAIPPSPAGTFQRATSASNSLLLLGSTPSWVKFRSASSCGSARLQPSYLHQFSWLAPTEFNKQLRDLGSSTHHSQVGKSRRWRAEVQSNVEDSSPTVSPLLSKTPSPQGSVLEASSGVQKEDDISSGESMLIGEDAGVFDVSSQKTSSWVLFTLVLGVVLAILYVTWLDPETGYGGAFIDAVSSLSSNHEVVMLIILFIFALVHSGLASLRGAGEKLIGERAYRVIFAGVSLPLAVSAVVYFINHRYDGVQLWQVRTVPGVHELVWTLSFVSFLFLYPSTFNLLEVAAVDKPKLHMWETGIMRITRHPQVLWCLAHTLWIGNSFTLTTSVGLLAHHLFGVWHGDKRLAERYGEAFESVKQRTSVTPFAAILEGRQKLPANFVSEFNRLPYYVIVGLTIGAYLSHPLMQIGSHYLRW